MYESGDLAVKVCGFQGSVCLPGHLEAREIGLEGDAGVARVLGSQGRHHRILPAVSVSEPCQETGRLVALADHLRTRQPIKHDMICEEMKVTYRTVMFFRNVWRYFNPLLLSAVSMVKLVEKMLASLAP